MSLSPFNTKPIHVYFYFPAVGEFLHFPTNASEKRIVVAKADQNLIKVKKAQTLINEEDFDDILASGSIPNMLKFMKNKNIQDKESGFKFHQIYFLCKDPTFFKEGINIMREKGLMDKHFWSYAIFHKDPVLMEEFFSHRDLGLKRAVGPQFQSSLLSVND